VIGCALSRRLAGAGLRVCLIDRSAPGQEASHAAAGMLAPSAEAEAPSPLFQFALFSRRMYPALADELTAETGIDPHYRHEGTLLPFSSPEEGERMRQQLAWQSRFGIHAELISASRMRDFEPSLATFAGALHLPEDHQIDNRLLMQALVRSCHMRGVAMALGEPALRILTARGCATGVQIGPPRSPRTITAANVINASGAWAAQVAGDGVPALPLRPVKGHMLALRVASSANGGAPRHVVRTPDVYLIPRRDGRIIVGSTMEEAGFDKTIHAAPLAHLLQAAQRACPPLAHAEWLEAWTGLRPATPDGLPIIGPLTGSLPGVANYWAALGHFRNGILLAPATAELLGGWLLTGQAPAQLGAFAPERFV
jgi:glycine oxidase